MKQTLLQSEVCVKKKDVISLVSLAIFAALCHLEPHMFGTKMFSEVSSTFSASFKGTIM